MDTLRWILLIFGLLLITAVYFTGRSKQPGPVRRREPGLDDSPHSDDAVEEDDPEEAGFEMDADDHGLSGKQEEAFDFERLLADAGSPMPSPAPKAKSRDARHSMLLEDEFVVIHLMASSGPGISGSRVYSALQELGFELEEDNIFHYRESNSPLIVVNMFKPGIFPRDPDDFISRGVSFILRLSKASQPLDAFDEMVSLAYELKSMLNFQLFDMQRSSLTKQTIALLEEEVGEYQRRRDT